MDPRPNVLFLDFHPDGEGSVRKLAGIRRFARTQDWNVVAIPPDESRARQVKPLLARHRPVGCIVERASWDAFLPPVLFGSVPVVYLDPPDPAGLPPAPGISVVCDNAAVARTAFRELSAGMPPCLAAVPSPGLPRWNLVRIATFRALCEEAGIECRTFDGIANEDREKRISRLARWLALLPKRTGVFGANDNAARDVVAAAMRVPRHIPKELAVVGVDGAGEGSFPVPVTSVKLDLELAGYQAARALAERLSGRRGGRPAGPPPSFGPLLVLRRRSTQGPGRREPLILEAVDVIRREAGEGLTAAALAARFPVSRKHFERRFREAMGHSVLDEILHVRLGMALDMLSQSHVPIGTIADFCGFGTQRGLRKLFRARFGTSMEAWREAHGLS